MSQGRFFAKEGNWPYYVARDGKGRCPIRTSRGDAEADVTAMGGEYVLAGISANVALPMIAMDEKFKQIQSMSVAA